MVGTCQWETEIPLASEEEACEKGGGGGVQQVIESIEEARRTGR